MMHIKKVAGEWHLPKHKTRAENENDTRQKHSNIDSVHRQEQRPALPIILLLEPGQHCPKNAETLQYQTRCMAPLP